MLTEIIVDRATALRAWADGIMAIAQKIADAGDPVRAVGIHQSVYMPLCREWIWLTPEL